MKANEYKLIRQAVEEGIAFGVRRAYKHVDTYPPNAIQMDTIAEEAINSICEWFVFEGASND